jgi:uncharacterized protein YigA (DUF484 family)
MSEHSPTLSEQDLADYLLATPDFFDRHADLLAQIQLVSPHGRRAVSLQERQIELQREKTKALELKIANLVRNAQENEAIQDKLMRWTRSLLLERDVRRLPQHLVEALRDGFSLPQAGLKLWRLRDEFADLAEAQGYSDDVISFADSLSMPYCGVNSGFEAAAWGGQPETVASLALLPLRRLPAEAAGPVLGGAGSTFGLLMLGSPDAARFQEHGGVDFLLRIAELASAALDGLAR